MTEKINSNNRIVIFAAFDKDCCVKDYVISYLKYLKEVTRAIVFVADNKLVNESLNKLEPLVSHVIAQKHGEYDFGSYKRGILWAKAQGLLEKYDELILCNDSCFCAYSLKKTFDKMSAKDCDFWAMTGSNEVKPHLQSSFLVFKKSVFLTQDFIHYFEMVGVKDNFWEIVTCYEIPLKEYFENLGFKSDFVFTINTPRKVGVGGGQAKVYNPTLYPVMCLKHGVPLIKRKIFVNVTHIQQSTSFIKTVLYLKFKYPKTYQYVKELLRQTFAKSKVTGALTAIENPKAAQNIETVAVNDGGENKKLVGKSRIVLAATKLQFKPRIDSFKNKLSFLVTVYKKILRFIYRKEVSKRGLVKHRFLSIPFIVYRKHI